MTEKASYILLVILLVMGVKASMAQITITPIFLFLDEQERFGSILIMNGSDQAQEVSVTFPFGYPITDEDGNVEMVYDDSSMAEKWGISEIIRGFPRNFTLQSGERQVVRLTIQPKDFEDGMYWSRIRTTSTPVSPEVGETDQEDVTTQITYKFEQNTTIFYKHGNVNTGLDINELTTEQNDKSVNVSVDLTRRGNAPFLGSLILNVRNSQGETEIEKRTSTSIYFDHRQVFTIEKANLSPGEYTIEFRAVSQRSDVPNSDIIPIDPITRRTKLKIN